MNKGLWQETVRVNAYKEDLGSCNRYKRGVCTKEGESIFIIEKRERGATRVYQGIVEKRVY